MSENRPLRLAVFLSGSGRTLANLIDRQRQDRLPAEIVLVISSRSKVAGVTIARDAGLDTRILLKSKHPDANDYSNAMFQPCRDLDVDLVVMAGFLKHVLIPDDFEQRVINIHPSLLPSFGGSGMYGDHVHKAVLEAGVKTSGCTVHFVDNEFDNGPIVLQRSCDVLDSDTHETLAARVFELELAALPDAIVEIAKQRTRA